MTKSLKSLGVEERPILSEDGMMVDRELYCEYIEQIVDLNGPNRREVLATEGFRLPLPRIEWPLIGRELPAYRKEKGEGE
jgi:hypothetical protein